MPGRDGQTEYNATPNLMARAEDVICDVFGAETDVVFHFTTRSSQSWLRSTYKHNLRTSRLTLDEADYLDAFGVAADLNRVIDAVARSVTGAVHCAKLEQLTGPFGPAQPLVDLMELPDHRKRHLKPHPPENTGPQDELIDDLLALNRANLSDNDLAAAKADLLEKATQNDG